MVSTNLIMKVLAGVSAVAVVATGGYLLLRSTSDVVSNQALESEEGWKVTRTPETFDKSKPNVEIRVEWKKDDKTWTSKIKGFLEKPEDGYSIDDIKMQSETLKKELGIKENKRDKNIQQNLKTFIANSKKHRIKSTKTTFESVIDLGTLKAESKKYKFKEEDFKKLYDGSSEIFKKLNISKTKLDTDQDISHQELKSIKFEGKTDFTIANDAKITLKIEKNNNASEFPEGFKFTLKSDKEVKIAKGADDKTPITLKDNTANEFKIKINGETYSLEKK